MRPVEKQLESGPFDDRTGYRAEYVQHALEPKPPKQVSLRPTVQWLDTLRGVSLCRTVGVESKATMTSMVTAQQG